MGRARCSGHTHEEILEILDEGNIEVDLLEPYTGLNNYVTVRCRKCGHEWSTTPHTLIYSRGCQQCRRERMASGGSGGEGMTHDEFVERVFEANPDLIVYGIFKDVDAFVPCGCARCHRTWMGNPRRMLAGYGCNCPKFRISNDCRERPTLASVSGMVIADFRVPDDEWAEEFFPIPDCYVTEEEMDALMDGLLG